MLHFKGNSVNRMPITLQSYCNISSVAVIYQLKVQLYLFRRIPTTLKKVENGFIYYIPLSSKQSHKNNK